LVVTPHGDTGDRTGVEACGILAVRAQETFPGKLLAERHFMVWKGTQTLSCHLKRLCVTGNSVKGGIEPISTGGRDVRQED